MFNKIGYFLCVSLVFLGLPAYGEVSLDQEDVFEKLANHSKAPELLALKGAGPAGNIGDEPKAPAAFTPPPVQTQTSYDTTAEDEAFAAIMVVSIVAVAVGVAYFAVYGTA